MSTNQDAFNDIETNDIGSQPEIDRTVPDTPLIKNRKKRFSEMLEANKYCYIAAFITAAIMMFVYFVYKFYGLPFFDTTTGSFIIGTKTILRMDLYHQYGPLFSELYERVINGDSLLYSWTSGLGSSFLGNFLNYLASPSGIFMFLFGHENMPEAIAAMVLTKAAFSAGTFAYFIRKIFNRNDASIAAFGILYSFCGWFMAYYWNIMWLDGMVAFPLIMLGITFIINGKKPYLYLFSMLFAMLTSYYMAYMCCILSVIFFLFYYFSNYDLGAFKDNYSDYLTMDEYRALSKKQKITGFFDKLKHSRFVNSGISFAGYSVLAFTFAAFALIPLYFVLKNCSATGSTFPDSFSSYFDIFDFIANHLAGATPTIRSSGEDVLPNIYSGILPLVLIPLYLFSKKITMKEKIASIVLFTVFFFSFNLNILNFIWHGFHYPNDLPYRFSFAYSFFLLYFAYKVFDNIGEFTGKQISISALSIIVFAVVAQKVTSKNVDTAVVISSIVFAFIYAVVLIFVKNPKYLKNSITALLLCCVITECIIVDTPNFEMTVDKTSFTSKLEDFQNLKATIDSTEGEGTFYRMELTDLLARMDNSWYYYNGASVFSSMAYESVSKLQKKLGMYGNDVNSYTYNPQTAVYNSMFGIKYLFENGTVLNNDKFYTYVNGNETFNAYRYNYDLPLAFCVNPDIINYWNTTDDNPFNVQESFWASASGVYDIFKAVTPVVSSSKNVNTISESDLMMGSISYSKSDANSFGSFTLTVTPETSGNVYIYASSSNIESIMIDNGNTGKDYNISTPYIYDAGHVNAGSSVSCDVSLPDEVEKATGILKFYAVIMDEDEFIKGYNNIKSSGVLNITEYDETRIKGTINSAANKAVFTSIPYDKGWSVYVDGEKVHYSALSNSFIAFNIAEGEHTVEFKFVPQGMYLGVTITVCSILLFILVILTKKSRKKKLERIALFLNEKDAAEVESENMSSSDDEIADGFADFEAEKVETPPDASASEVSPEPPESMTDTDASDFSDTSDNNNSAGDSTPNE